MSLLIFDLDDTLVDTSDVYWKAKSAFIKSVLHYSDVVTAEFIDGLFEETDSINMLKFGHSPNRYGQSMLDTYKKIQHLGLIKSDSKLKSEIVKAGNIILNSVPELIDGAIQMLEWCSKRYALALITRGQEDLQLKKINSHALKKYFQEIKVVDNKSDADFLSIIEILKSDVKATWIIGDSLKAEIETGLNIGAKCIFFNYKHESYNWIQERNYSIKSKKSFYKVEHLDEIPALLIKANAFD